MTDIPRWISPTDAPADGGSQLAWLDVPHSLDASVSGYGTAGDLLVAAHARVLADLTGATDVQFAERRCDGSVLVRRIAVSDGPWHQLIEDSRECRSVPDAGDQESVDSVDSVDSVNSVDSVVEALAEDPVDRTNAGPLEVTLRLIWTPVRLRVGYRPDRLDEPAAGRIAGYHLAALDAMINRPELAHRQTSLLAKTEHEQQIHSMSGPVVGLPDSRVHQLIEDRVRRQPDLVAAVCGADRLTYAELNRRANKTARALRNAGVGTEDVVALVSERNLDWLVGVLAIMKAGSCYLPIEPHFPPGRIEASLRRSECRTVLTEPGSRTALDEALTSVSGVNVHHLADLRSTDLHDTDLHLRIGPDQLAYIYFTSGSTGEPKGAMCEQAGMLNHILAKITDLEIRDGAVVAQTAPQCFDISLWQLLAGLVVGGTTVIIEQAAILDLPTMIDTVRSSRIEVLQLVPSYLEVVLSYLDTDPVALPDLRVVSVTGEAVKPDLVQRFFAHPVITGASGIALVNAYGLTETSDDTNHEVMRSMPADHKITLGRPVRNVWIYVVDEHLRPVPLGAPGEIVFSGVCVGRGYVNDPERTAAAFRQDPHRPGNRLYRSGDIGRWRPDGKLEFLGRRDSQLKISGFRIEIGEIENTLLGAAGVRDAAVVVIEAADESRHLVGFYAAERSRPAAELHDHLARTLPSYMVPGTIHHRVSLPLSANGKIDRNALTTLARELARPVGGDVDDDEPATSTDQTSASRTWTSAELDISRAWARVLGIEAVSIRRTDHFFDRGGTSLSAVKVIIALDRLLTLKDVATHPVLTDLASRLDARRHELAER